MLFVLTLTAVLAFSAQAAPQFNNPNLGDSESWDTHFRDRSRTKNENHHQNRDTNQYAFSTQSTFNARRHHPNHHGREIDENHQEFLGQCWDPVYHVYRDGPTSQPPSQYPYEYHNEDRETQTNYNPNHYRDGHWGGPQAPSGPPPPHRHGPPSHHHGPPHHHGPQHHHGSSHHHHGPSHHHGYGPPHHHGQGPPPLPPRPPHRPHDAHSHYELELCQDTSKENVQPEKLQSSTSGDVVDVVSSPTPAVSSTSIKPKDADKVEGITQSPIKVTTEFDWNNYFIDGAAADNTGGAGVIDIRSGGLMAT